MVLRLTSVGSGLEEPACGLKLLKNPSHAKASTCIGCRCGHAQLLNLGTAVTVRWHAGNWHWHAVNRQLPSTQQSIDPAINTALGATILVTLLSRFFQEIHASSVIGCHPTGAIATGSIDTATTVYNLYYCSRQLNNLRQKCIISAVAETPSRFFSILKGITEIYRMKQIANAVIIYKSPIRSHLKYTGGSTSAQFNCAFLYLCSTFVFTSINGELQR